MSTPYCNVCGVTVESADYLTYLELFINGSEGTHACEDCRMDITNFARALSSSMNRANRQVRLAQKPERFPDLVPGVPLKRMREEPLGSTERVMFEFTAGENSASLGYEVTPGAFRNQILELGRVSTGRGEVFLWNSEKELWEEEASGHPRDLRRFKAAKSGFPDDDEGLEWRFQLPAFKTGHGIRKPDGSIHANMKVDELRIAEESSQ